MPEILTDRLARIPAQRSPHAATVHGYRATPYMDALPAEVTREVLSRALREVCTLVGAQQYCIADLSRSHAEEPPTIMSSNWSFDAIEIIGTVLMDLLHQSSLATSLGQPTCVVELASLRPIGDRRFTSLLAEFGHAEIALLRLRAGSRRGICILSAEHSESLDAPGLARAHLICNYLFSRHGQATAAGETASLSERERECLLWVSEGKTTQEIALILGVSANTVNKYIVSSIQKLGAGNRSMAVAVAVRAGLI